MTEKKNLETGETPGTVSYTPEDPKDSEFLEKYIHPKKFGSKFWVKVFLAAAFVLLAFIVKTTVFDRVVDPKLLVESIEVFDIHSKWVVKEEVDTPDFKGLVIVPQVKFRVRNIGKTDLKYVYFLGVFRVVNRSKALGEDFRTVFDNPLKPGAESESITMTSQYGYRAKSVAAFDASYKEWKESLVQLFVRSGGSQLEPLKTFYLSRRVEGAEINIKIKGHNKLK